MERWYNSSSIRFLHTNVSCCTFLFNCILPAYLVGVLFCTFICSPVCSAAPSRGLRALGVRIKRISFTVQVLCWVSVFFFCKCSRFRRAYSKHVVCKISYTILPPSPYFFHFLNRFCCCFHCTRYVSGKKRRILFPLAVFFI